MYISRILLDVNNPAVRRDLIGLKGLNETLDICTGRSKPLFRLDSVALDKNNFLQPVVMVSSKKPDADGVPPGYFSSLEVFDYNIPVRKGMNFSFILRANPSTKIFFRDVELDDAKSQIKWLESESYKNGFEIIDCAVTSEGYISCSEREEKFMSAIFKGNIRVTRDDNFRRALYEGVGRGREYGLGLLSVESFACREKRNMEAEMKGQPDIQ